MTKGQVYLEYILKHYEPPFTMEHIYKDLAKYFNTTRDGVERALRYYCVTKTEYKVTKEMVWNEYRRKNRRDL